MANKYNGKNSGGKKHFKKKLQEFEDSGFGDYKESTGGGHPFEAGNTNTRTTQENGKIRKSENAGKTMQPRTDDGKFTYKSVNGQSIDPKYGPSRGKTVNPLLTAGQNGVYIKEDKYDHDVYSNGKIIHKKGDVIKKSADGNNVTEQFEQEGGDFWDKWKDKWYRKSGKVVTEDLSTQVAAEAIWETGKRMYDEVKGEFQDESELFSTKSGRKSKTEKAAIENVKKTGQEQGVIDPESGGIELKDKIKKALVEEGLLEEEPVGEEPVAGGDNEEPVGEEPVQEQAPKMWGSSQKYTMQEHDDFIAGLKEKLGAKFDPNFWTDEKVEKFMDKVYKK